jgi:hypothetical protein
MLYLERERLLSIVGLDNARAAEATLAAEHLSLTLKQEQAVADEQAKTQEAKDKEADEAKSAKLLKSNKDVKALVGVLHAIKAESDKKEQAPKDDKAAKAAREAKTARIEKIAANVIKLQEKAGVAKVAKTASLYSLNDAAKEMLENALSSVKEQDKPKNPEAALLTVYAAQYSQGYLDYLTIQNVGGGLAAVAALVGVAYFVSDTVKAKFNKFFGSKGKEVKKVAKANPALMTVKPVSRQAVR